MSDGLHRRGLARKGKEFVIGHAFAKIILFGEHSVVYGRPAIAVPVREVRATVSVENTVPGSGIVIHATDIGRTIDVRNASPDEPLSLTVRNTLAYLEHDTKLDIALTIHSTIPVASGLGSGAAVATAIVRALSAYLGQPLDAAAASDLVYETEKCFHGTPSGVDNTVVAFEKPVYFRKGHAIETFVVKKPFWIAVADTGLPSLTAQSVGDVRAAWQREPARYNAIFDRIGALVNQARQAIEIGETETLGARMNENQRLLRELDVSSPELEILITAALQAGAVGAKLSGGGRGGNMIALIAPDNAERARYALSRAGAKRVIVTRVGTDIA
jgi:mevalonate kinase